jgi:hypothetical protein
MDQVKVKINYETDETEKDQNIYFFGTIILDPERRMSAGTLKSNYFFLIKI